MVAFSGLFLGHIDIVEEGGCDLASLLDGQFTLDLLTVDLETFGLL